MPSITLDYTFELLSFTFARSLAPPPQKQVIFCSAFSPYGLTVIALTCSYINYAAERYSPYLATLLTLFTSIFFPNIKLVLRKTVIAEHFTLRKERNPTLPPPSNHKDWRLIRKDKI